MTRLNLILVLIAVICAVGVVTSQHKARKLFTELQQEQEQAKRMDVEWGQLQLEQSTWAMHARIEKIATHYLEMQVPDSARIQVVPAQGITDQAKSDQEKPGQDKGAHP
ncbi:MAG: cell division protein FtsL [Gallionella sp.]|nr:cell division protein FtsL [Gallionella sp.]